MNTTKKKKGWPPPETLNREFLTADEIRIVEEQAQFLTQPQLADYLGMQRGALSRIMDKCPEVGEAYRRGKSKMLSQVADNLMQKALKGDTACMIFLLKTQGGWCEKQKIEHSGSINTTVTIFELPNNKREGNGDN